MTFNKNFGFHSYFCGATASCSPTFIESLKTFLHARCYVKNNNRKESATMFESMFGCNLQLILKKSTFFHDHRRTLFCSLFRCFLFSPVWLVMIYLVFRWIIIVADPVELISILEMYIVVGTNQRRYQVGTYLRAFLLFYVCYIAERDQLIKQIL